MISVDDRPSLSTRAVTPDPAWDPRVLVVDDDATSQLAAAGLLRGLGLRVDVAADGRQALEMSGQWPYVAIFMDCLMPDVDGYTAARKLRNLEGRDLHTPVIATTSSSRSVSLASGMDHHLTKPLDIDVLRADCGRLGLLALPQVAPKGSPHDPKPLLDPAIFVALTDDRRASRVTSSLTLIRETTSRLPELWRTINIKDFPSLHRTALNLRDRATALGLQRVAEACDGLCLAAAGGEAASASENEMYLRQVLVDSATAIRDYVNGVPSTHGSAAPVTDFAKADVSVPPTPAPVRVAIADDDPLARFAIGAMLKRADWLELVGEAAGVEEIVELVAVEQPEVVVLDWIMPGGGGREATRRILERSPQMLIVALTSSDSLEALTEMTSAGASCLVAKGGSADQLTETIRRALKASARARAAENEQQSGRQEIAGGLGPDHTLAGESPLDPAGVQRLLSEFGSTGVLTELVALFAKDTPARLRDMRSGYDAGDATAVGANAHQLKGGCLTLAANAMAELCHRLELEAAAGSLDGALTLIGEIENTFVSTRAALAAIV